MQQAFSALHYAKKVPNSRKYQKELPKKSATGLAINYALNNETALKRFLDDGKIEIDNNAAERAMRVIAQGRKNWMFAGSDAGGETAAAIYTITETYASCKAGIDFSNYTSLRFQGSRSAIFFAL